MTQENYTPYGEEWKTQFGKLPKAAIVDIAANLGKEAMALRELITALHADLLATHNDLATKDGRQYEALASLRSAMAKIEYITDPNA